MLLHIIFFSSTCQIILALPRLAVAETEKIHQKRPAKTSGNLGNVLLGTLSHLVPWLKLPFLGADRLMRNNPITLARRDRAPRAEVCYY